MEKRKARICFFYANEFLDINDAIKELTKIFKECGICFRVSKTTKGAPVQGFIKK